MNFLKSISTGLLIVTSFTVMIIIRLNFWDGFDSFFHKGNFLSAFKDIIYALIFLIFLFVWHIKDKSDSKIENNYNSENANENDSDRNFEEKEMIIAATIGCFFLIWFGAFYIIISEAKEIDPDNWAVTIIYFPATFVYALTMIIPFSILMNIVAKSIEGKRSILFDLFIKAGLLFFVLGFLFITYTFSIKL